MKVNRPCRVLVMDDGPDLREQVRVCLDSATVGFEVDAAGLGAEALACAAEARANGRPYALVFAAPGPPPARHGIETLARLREEDPLIEVIVCGGASDSPAEDAAAACLDGEPYLFLKAPLEAGAARQLAHFLARKSDAARQAREQSNSRLASAEEARRAAQEQYRLLFDNNPIPIYKCDQTTFAFLEVNEAAVRLYGYSREEFLAMTLLDLMLPEDIPAFRQRVSQPAPGAGNFGVWRHRVRNGKLLEVEITSHDVAAGGRKAWLSMVNDVSERSGLEAQLRQAQKMESVGQLASGIAHDFNNLLTVISGHVGMLMAGPPDSAKPGDSLKEIAAATKRASDLTRQLMTFSRKHELHLQVADLNEIVNNVGKMLRRILGEDIELLVDFAPGLPSIKADLGMLEQVLMNLAVNSRDAMPAGGRLLIRTAAARIGEEHARQNAEAVPGRFVCLTISDTGCGIAPENLGRIFEPFFTTKELGHGTGLGLATVYGIVKQHQGWIEVASRLNEGTTFRVYFPAWHEKSVSPIMPKGEQKVIGGAETILLVEDEEPLLKLMRHILESYGYKVLVSSTGKEALGIWEQHKKKIDLLLSDLILPDGMSGQELAKILQAEKPGIKVVYTSGYDSGRLAGDFAPGKGEAFIQKPFHARKLAEIVYDTLRERQER
jgi:PAS domain S-box-containing protein